MRTKHRHLITACMFFSTAFAASKSLAQIDVDPTGVSRDGTAIVDDLLFDAGPPFGEWGLNIEDRDDSWNSVYAHAKQASESPDHTVSHSSAWFDAGLTARAGVIDGTMGGYAQAQTDYAVTFTLTQSMDYTLTARTEVAVGFDGALEDTASLFATFDMIGPNGFDVNLGVGMIEDNGNGQATDLETYWSYYGPEFQEVRGLQGVLAAGEYTLAIDVSADYSAGYTYMSDAIATAMFELSILPSQMAVQAVPEPATMATALIGGVMLLGRPRRGCKG